MLFLLLRPVKILETLPATLQIKQIDITTNVTQKKKKICTTKPTHRQICLPLPLQSQECKTVFKQHRKLFGLSNFARTEHISCKASLQTHTPRDQLIGLWNDEFCSHQARTNSAPKNCEYLFNTKVLWLLRYSPRWATETFAGWTVQLQTGRGATKTWTACAHRSTDLRTACVELWVGTEEMSATKYRFRWFLHSPEAWEIPIFGLTTKQRILPVDSFSSALEHAPFWVTVVSVLAQALEEGWG